MNPETLQNGLILFVILVGSLSIHEAAHALAAKWLGDDTAEREGRLSLNPLVHLDQLGTVMLIVMALSNFGIGWAKPVPVNPLRFKRRFRDMGLVALAGPSSNLILAFLFFWLLVLEGRIVPSESMLPFFRLLDDVLFMGVKVNIGLAVFNMLPLYPLDGQKVLSGILPVKAARTFDFQMIRMGAWPLLVVIVWEWVMPIPGPLGLLLGPVWTWIWQIFQFSASWVG
jgi:Zn-dependent protease